MADFKKELKKITELYVATRKKFDQYAAEIAPLTEARDDLKDERHTLRQKEQALVRQLGGPSAVDKLTKSSVMLASEEDFERADKVVELREKIAKLTDERRALKKKIAAADAKYGPIVAQLDAIQTMLANIRIESSEPGALSDKKKLQALAKDFKKQRKAFEAS